MGVGRLAGSWCAVFTCGVSEILSEFGRILAKLVRLLAEWRLLLARLVHLLAAGGLTGLDARSIYPGLTFFLFTGNRTAPPNLPLHGNRTFLLPALSYRGTERNAFLLPCTDFLPLHGQSNRISFYLGPTFYPFTGNRNAFLLPWTNFLPSRAIEQLLLLPWTDFLLLHGQSKRNPTFSSIKKEPLFYKSSPAAHSPTCSLNEEKNRSASSWTPDSSSECSDIDGSSLRSFNPK